MPGSQLSPASLQGLCWRLAEAVSDLWAGSPGKTPPELRLCCQHSSGKPLTSGAMSAVLHKHSKFIIQTPSISSGLVQLFDKHSIYTAMGRTKKNLSFKRKKKNI